jgi:hypothetical protein
VSMCEAFTVNAVGWDAEELIAVDLSGACQWCYRLPLLPALPIQLHILWASTNYASMHRMAMCLQLAAGLLVARMEELGGASVKAASCSSAQIQKRGRSMGAWWSCLCWAPANINGGAGHQSEAAAVERKYMEAVASDHLNRGSSCTWTEERVRTHGRRRCSMKDPSWQTTSARRAGLDPIGPPTRPIYQNCILGVGYRGDKARMTWPVKFKQALQRRLID